MPQTTSEHKPAGPRILVSGSLSSPYASDYLACTLREFSDSAFAGLKAAGASVSFVEASAPQLTQHEALEDVDGVLMLGGADADPQTYGQQVVADSVYGIHRAADDYEIGLLSLAREKGLPILGICRGMQLLNIAAGGDMVQEIGGGTMHYLNADNSVMTAHPTEILPDTRLEEVYGAGEIIVRSGHHQAVSKVGEGLRVASRAADGIVEALEGTDDAWVVGVQWHPEDPKASHEDFERLVGAFLAHCRRA